MTHRVVTPRHVYPSIQALADDLGADPTALYRYLERRGGAYHLRPLDAGAYAAWHRQHYPEGSMPTTTTTTTTAQRLIEALRAYAANDGGALDSLSDAEISHLYILAGQLHRAALARAVERAAEHAAAEGGA